MRQRLFILGCAIVVLSVSTTDQCVEFDECGVVSGHSEVPPHPAHGRSGYLAA
jgi:hypothetical protein